MNISEYIQRKTPGTIREHRQDEGTLIGLPFPYTVPCAETHFNELYYWDTFFTNKGLFLLGMIEQAKNNVCDILFLIEKFGYMPNGNRTYLAERSQPPYAALMAEDVYRHTNDSEFLRYAYDVLQKEYEFWMTHRATTNGLNRFGCENDAESCAQFYNDCVAVRVGKLDRRTPQEAGKHYLAEAESGWDFTPRFHGYCMDYNPVDLNSNLYIYEKLFAKYEAMFALGDGKQWEKRAQKRLELVNTLLWDKACGCYKDYNYKTDAVSDVVSAAGFQPYFAGIAGNGRSAALKNLFKMLKSSGGIFTTSEVPEKTYQWAYPNLWAPCQYIAYKALLRYDFKDESKWIAEKYIRLLEGNFARYGKLFEKYNGITCGIDAASEYGTPEMLGWTAGVYLYLINESKYNAELK